jgi:hypothetical protein
VGGVKIPAMPVPDDPAPSAARRARIGLWAGAAVTAIAVAVAVLFGVSRADDPGKIVTEVVALHDRERRRPPAPDSLHQADPGPYGPRIVLLRDGDGTGTCATLM